MKKTLCGLILLLALAVGAGAQTIMNTCSATATSGAADATCTISIGAHHFIVVAFWVRGAFVISENTFSLSFTNYYQTSTDGTDCGFVVACNAGIAVAQTGASSGSTTFKAHNAQFSNNAALYVFEYSGIATSSAIDGTPTGAFGTSTSTTISSGNTTTSGSGDLLIGVGWSSSTLTAGSGYSVQGSVTGYTAPGYTINLYVETKTSGAAGNYAATFTVGSSPPWAVEVAAAIPASPRGKKLKVTQSRLRKSGRTRRAIPC